MKNKSLKEFLRELYVLTDANIQFLCGREVESRISWIYIEELSKIQDLINSFNFDCDQEVTK
jgi:hypothetical protein